MVPRQFWSSGLQLRRLSFVANTGGFFYLNEVEHKVSECRWSLSNEGLGIMKSKLSLFEDGESPLVLHFKKPQQTRRDLGTWGRWKLFSGPSDLWMSTYQPRRPSAVRSRLRGWDGFARDKQFAIGMHLFFCACAHVWSGIERTSTHVYDCLCNFSCQRFQLQTAHWFWLQVMELGHVMCTCAT